MRLHNGGDFVTSSHLEQLSVQEQKLNEEFSHAFETYSHSCASHPSKVNRKRSRERAYATDRQIEDITLARCFTRIGSFEKSSDHSFHAYFIMQDLCRNRLGGGSASISVIFLELFWISHSGPQYYIYIDMQKASLLHLAWSILIVAHCSTLETRGNKSVALLALLISPSKEQISKMMKGSHDSSLKASFDSSKSNKSHIASDIIAAQQTVKDHHEMEN
ncbi:basic helix-loop-helix transcription factor [Salvia divinorum]|uniref:Basic helix-loop-helix transcription factor n=1 Tax=Salvia divinorum TaxID=28513 RepID=A0ABD1GWW4_SALDI